MSATECTLHSTLDLAKKAAQLNIDSSGHPAPAGTYLLVWDEPHVTKPETVWSVTEACKADIAVFNTDYEIRLLPVDADWTTKD